MDKSRLDQDTRKALDVCYNLLLANKPAVILVDGGLGTGKTTHDILIADYFNGKELPFEDFLGMGARSFMSIYDKQKGKLKCLVYDEAGDFSRRGAMTKVVRDLGRIFETFRQYNMVLVISLPRFYWLDSKIFELDVVRILIHCYNRNHTYCKTKIWFPDRIDWLVTKADEMKKKGFPPKIVYGKVQPNCYGWFFDLEPKRREALRRYSLHGKDAISQDVLLDQEGLISMQQIAPKVGRSVLWIRKKLKLLKIKPVKVYKTRNYYSKEVIGALIEELRE